jgi:uncharacterized protein DUF4166
MQLYERLLGASFERLPPALRRFHAQGGGTAAFALEVTRGPGLLQRGMASLLRLPAATPQAQGRLTVTVQGDHEVWERTFPDTKLRTVQWMEGALLVEATGPMQFLFDVTADENGMRFAPAGCRFLGRRLPQALAPRISSTVRGETGGWDLRVSMALPGLGPIVAYGGSVTPLP